MKNVNKNKIIGNIIINTGYVVFISKFKNLPSDQLICRDVSLEKFKKFISYCNYANALEGAEPKVCATTLRLLFNEFSEMEFNKAMTKLLWQNNIHPPMPIYNPSSDACGNASLSSSWLKETRQWLRKQLRRVYY